MEKVKKTEVEWRTSLSPQQFDILRKHATERPFTGPHQELGIEGTYVCAGCGLPLFESSSKFDAGCGWPSFSEKLNPENVAETVDKTHGMVRTEVHCARCDGHLGHVFDDGPQPTGLRYCINGHSLKLAKK